MPEFVPPGDFVTPRSAPRFTTGRVVIHSDDGNIGDFTHFWPRFRAYHRVSQFRGKRLAPFCPSINSGSIGSGSNKMTWDQVRRLQREGGEIISHGRWHLGLSSYNLVEAVSAGATSLKVNVSQSGAGEAYGGDKLYQTGPAAEGVVHVISEGATSEDITLTGTDNGSVTLSGPLANAYTTAAKVRLSEASTIAVLQGCLDDIEAQGIAFGPHHVWTWHDNDAEARAIAAGIFDSARAGTQGIIDPSGSVDFYNLNSRLGFLTTPPETIDALYDAVQVADGVLILYGHGEQDAQRMEHLEYALAQAVERGIRIVTHSEAVAYLQASD